MSSKSKMITRGQAACIVLGLEPNDENRKEAKTTLDTTPFDVCYNIIDGPLKPVVMGKIVMRRNPFIHQPYLDTRSNTPEEEEDTVSPKEISSSQSSEEGTSTNYSKTNIMHHTKLIFFPNNPEADEETSTQVFVTTTQMFEVIQEYLPKLNEYVSPLTYAKWIAEEEKYFGGRKTKRIHKKQVQGRYLYLLNSNNRRGLQETNTIYRQHLKNNSEGWANIGYVRKSETKETDEIRIRLLKTMMMKLKNRCYCEKIFVSPKTSSTKPIMQRDYQEDKEIIINKLDNCSGTTQDLLDYLSTTVKNVRISTISYAGLSNDPNDVYNFLKAYKVVKEVVVDHGDSIEVLDRASLCTGAKEKLSLFKSRSGPIKRSS